MYGGHLATFPVTDNSVWQVGPHRFICGDAIKLHQTGRLNHFIPAVDIVHTDPPWGQGNRRMFYNKAGIEVQDSFTSFIAGLVAVLKALCPNGWVSVEMSNPMFTVLADTLSQDGGTCWDCNTTYYKPGARAYPVPVWVGTFGTQQCNITIPDGLINKAALRWILQTAVATMGHPATYYDPCCGQLVYGLAALRAGVSTIYGTEIIPAKLAAGIARLAKQGLTVERID